MKIAHLADLHLGFTRYQREVGGINQRQADVVQAFRRLVDDVIAAQPDLILVAGDLFHTVRPSNLVIVEARRQFRRLREGCPDAVIAIVGGNHDTPRSTATGNPLLHFEDIPGHAGVFIATYQSTQVRLPHPLNDVVLTLVPSPDLKNVPKPAEDAINVLLMHAAVQGMRYGRVSQAGFEDVAPVSTEGWAYVALGDYHVAHEVAPRVWYPGSIEYTSSNPWDELNDEERHGRRGQKGWLLAELDHRGLTVTFQPVALTRQHYDLPVLDATDCTAEEMVEFIRYPLGAIDVEHEIVRQKVINVPRTWRRDPSIHRLIRELNGKSGGFYRLDLRFAARVPASGLTDLVDEMTPSACVVCEDTKVAPDGEVCWSCMPVGGDVQEVPTDLADRWLKGELTVDEVVARMNVEDPYHLGDRP